MFAVRHNKPDFATGHATRDDVDRLSFCSRRERQTVNQITALDTCNQSTVDCVQYQTTARTYK